MQSWQHTLLGGGIFKKAAEDSRVMAAECKAQYKNDGRMYG
jgi:hypothetical protein